MIQFAHAPPCGNAAAINLGIAPQASAWRLLRRADDDFVGEIDAGATVIAEGDDGDAYVPVLDYVGLTNGVPAWYQEYELIDGLWAAPGDPVSVTPAYLAEPLYASPDLASLLRERISLVLRAEVVAGRLRHESGAVPVLTAYPLLESIRLPVVTIILSDRHSEVRGIGEIVTPDAFDGTYWDTFEGWMDRSTVQIAVWSLNHEDRLQVRDAVQRAVMLNLPILDSAGFVLPELSESDSQDFESYSAPIYQSIFTLSCLHATLVRSQFHSIHTVEVTANA
jgi:hypothetical protein